MPGRQPDMYPVSKGAALLSPPDVAASARRQRFEDLYNAHHVSLLGYALRRTANTDDAADVLAETFLAAWRRLDQVPPARPGSGSTALRAACWPIITAASDGGWRWPTA